jgi:hypothetical protein
MSATRMLASATYVTPVIRLAGDDRLAAKYFGVEAAGTLERHLKR